MSLASSIIAFIIKWSVGVAVMTCDIIFDVTVSILVLLETILIELFSVMCVLVIDVWKKDETIMDLNSTPTRDNTMADDYDDDDDDDGAKQDDDTASSTGSIDTNQTTETGSGSDELRMSYRHLKQEYKKKKKKARTHPEHVVGSQVIF